MRALAHPEPDQIFGVPWAMLPFFAAEPRFTVGAPTFMWEERFTLRKATRLNMRFSAGNFEVCPSCSFQSFFGIPART